MTQRKIYDPKELLNLNPTTGRFMRIPQYPERLRSEANAVEIGRATPGMDIPDTLARVQALAKRIDNGGNAGPYHFFEIAQDEA